MMHTVSNSVDASTYEEFAAASWPTLYRYAYLLAGNHADAEDIAQQTLINAHRAWPRIRSSDSPRAYLRQMLTNTFLSQRRPKARRLELLSDTVPEPVRPQTGGPEDRMVLWQHVNLLPPRQRAVIVLRYYEDLTEREIAETLGCSLGTVKSTAHHALSSMRAALGTRDADGKES